MNSIKIKVYFSAKDIHNANIMVQKSSPQKKRVFE